MLRLCLAGTKVGPCFIVRGIDLSDAGVYKQLGARALFLCLGVFRAEMTSEFPVAKLAG